MEHGEGITSSGVDKKPSIEASACLGGLSHSSDDVGGGVLEWPPWRSLEAWGRCQMARGTEKENPAVAPRADRSRRERSSASNLSSVTSLSRAG